MSVLTRSKLKAAAVKAAQVAITGLKITSGSTITAIEDLLASPPVESNLTEVQVASLASHSSNCQSSNQSLSTVNMTPSFVTHIVKAARILKKRSTLQKNSSIFRVCFDLRCIDIALQKPFEEATICYLDNMDAGALVNDLPPLNILADVCMKDALCEFISPTFGSSDPLKMLAEFTYYMGDF